MDDALKKTLAKIANTIRGLAMDAVQKANSGHPGLPMGCAELGAYLWGYALRYNPKDSNWMGRDRFILSAGHGCMLQYATLHLSGYKISLDDLKHFRQLHSNTPGHPEFGHTDGIEVTTGPLGQGVGDGVGLALGLKILATKFNTPKQPLFDSKVFVLAGDGCMMEGVSSEASSLAGYLQLDNLILIYDSNKICLDGPTSESFVEDTKTRYKAYGFEVYECDGQDLEAIDAVISSIRAHQERPAFVVLHTIIGKGSPNKQGTNKAHGSALGPEEVALAKKTLGLPEEDFYVPGAVRSFFEEKQKSDAALQAAWQTLFDAWSKENPERRAEFDVMHEKRLPSNIESDLRGLAIKAPIAGRSASAAVIKHLSTILPFLYGGSADLSGSDLTMMKQFPLLSPGHFAGRNIKFGVREFAMACAASGLSRTDMILPFVGTFLTFSDYMRNAIRLACLMKVQVIYHFTHDSIFLGEDGPTHQPVEHYMSLRTIPNLHFIRPGDQNEVKMAWLAALKYKGPTAFSLTRQNLPEVPGTDRPYAEGVGRGAYILKREDRKPDFTLVATGSELHLAHDVMLELEKRGKAVRLISMPCWELFEAQDKAYRDSLFGGDIGKRVSIEAGVAQGWYKYIGREGIAISQDGFGASAPASALATEFGFTVESILERVLA